MQRLEPLVGPARDAALLGLAALVPQQLGAQHRHRVSDTTAEITMVTASVMANSRNSRPTTSPMNSSGISTAISDTVSDTMVKPICPRP